MHRKDEILTEPKRSFWTTFLIGAGMMAAVDEIIFHQLLAWHHFYDQGTPAISLLSDGLLHAAELIALVAGFFMWADLRQRQRLSAAHARAGFFLGLGSFQVFDGIVDHKVLRLHQIRYGVDLLPYDLTWNLAGLLLMLIGALLLYRARKVKHAQPADQTQT
jgi:uncharacterized membrane protein